MARSKMPVGRTNIFWMNKILIGIIFLLITVLALHSPGRIIAETSCIIDINHFNTQTDLPPKQQSKTKFVFFVGIEGTGHHLIQSLASKSPDMKRLRALGLADTHYRLAQTNMQSNLRVIHPDISNSVVCNSTYKNSTHPVFVDLLRVFDALTPKGDKSSLTIPVNCIGHNTMASYPFGPKRKPCCSIPNIDQFYEACNQAEASCEHVFLYRDLHAVIASTTVKRKFNASVREAILLYTYILKEMYAALSKHSTKLASCLAVLEPNATKDTVWHPLADTLGWKGQHLEFDSFLNGTYRLPKPMSPLLRRQLVPSELSVEMDELERAQEHVLSLCPTQP